MGSSMRQTVLVAAIGALALLPQPGPAYADPGITSPSTAGALAAAMDVPAGGAQSVRFMKVMFIQGIGSVSACPNSDNAGESIPEKKDFVGRLSWLASALAQQDVGLDSDDFLYYAYRSPYTKNRLCADGETPNYSERDVCWSLDDVYKVLFFKKKAVPDGGQATRLASFLRNYLANNPGTNLSIVAHSQGGVLATYTIKEKLSQDYLDRIKAIVTFDSPLGGILKIAPEGLKIFSKCAGLDRRLDSSFDMASGSAVIKRINDGRDTPSTKLYTISADPGCLKLLVLCTPFPLIPNSHSDVPSWSKERHPERHLVVDVKTHSDIWEGRSLPGERLRLVRFTACAVAELPVDCKDFAIQPD